MPTSRSTSRDTLHNRCIELGVSRHEVERAVRGGRRIAAKLGRQGYRRDFPFTADWGGRRYTTKRVLVIVAEDEQQNLVITVYSFYF